MTSLQNNLPLPSYVSDQSTDEQHSLLQSTFLHLLPGVLVLVLYLVAGPLASRWGWPVSAGLSLFAFPLGIIGFMLGYLLLQGKRRNGQWRLTGIVLYRQPLPLWNYLIFTPILLAFSVAAFLLTAQPTQSFLWQRLFFWMPAWLYTPEDLTQFSRTVLISLFLIQIVVDGIAAPIAEELYFRGYLLPRLAHLGNWAPLVGTILFTLYHLDSPWSFVPRLLGFLPTAYVTYWKQNIVIPILVHCMLNLIGVIFVFLPVLSR
jgi:membrane protease YdiL (CAAX protease family)